MNLRLMFLAVAAAAAVALLATASTGCGESRNYSYPDDDASANETPATDEALPPPATTAGTANASYWVSTDGSDDNPGTQAEPFRTLLKASVEAYTRPRDIMVYPGIYFETQNIYIHRGVGIHGLGVKTVDPETYRPVIDFSACLESRCGIFVGSSEDSGEETEITDLAITAKGTAIFVTNASPLITGNMISTVGGTAVEYPVVIVASGTGATVSPVIEGNTIRAGDAWASGGGVSAGIVWYGQSGADELDITLVGNDISGGDGRAASYGISGSASGFDAVFDATIVGNVISSGISERHSYALALSGAGDAVPAQVAIEQNVVDGGGIVGTDAEAVTAGILATDIAGTLAIVNNAVHGGEGGVWADGVELVSCPDAYVHFNTIDAGWGVDGMSVLSLYSGSHADIRNNILCSQTSLGVGLYQNEATRAALANNLFCDDLDMPYIVSVNGIPTFYMDDAAINASGAGAVDNVTGDPQFADAANMDYHLKAGSDALDGAREIPGVLTDIEGDNRNIGFAPDIGAYEYP